MIPSYKYKPGIISLPTLQERDSWAYLNFISKDLS